MEEENRVWPGTCSEKCKPNFRFFYLLPHLVRMVWFIGFCSVAITLFCNAVTRQMMCYFEASVHGHRQFEIDVRSALFSSCLIHFMQFQHVTSSIYKLPEEKDFAFQPIFCLAFNFFEIAATPPSFSDKRAFVCV